MRLGHYMWTATRALNTSILPRENEEIYNAYVIDCVPEREDLGCLAIDHFNQSSRKMSTTLLNSALDPMGLSQQPLERRRSPEITSRHSAVDSPFVSPDRKRPPFGTGGSLAAGYAKLSDRLQRAMFAGSSLDQGFIIPVDDVRRSAATLECKSG